MSKRSLALLMMATVTAAILGCSFTDLLGLQPTATPTPTKTLMPTFTATPSVVPSPTDTPLPTSTAVPTTPPETPTPTQPPSPTPGPPTNTPTPGPPTNTPTPRPPAPTPTPRPTNTPQPAYEYHYVSGPIKDPCHPVGCVPEINGIVIDAQGEPIDYYNRVWLKLDSETFGVEYCPTGDESQALQPGQFKFGSPDGQLFGRYTLTVVRSEGDPTPLSAPLHEKMNSYQKGGQQTEIVFQRNY